MTERPDRPTADRMPAGEVLLITDDAGRTASLARDLGTSRACRVHDLYGDAAPSGAPVLIVSDVDPLTSDAILRLKRVLAAIRGEGVPYLFLTHGNAARAEAQARALGASRTFGAGTAAQVLLTALERPVIHPGPPGQSAAHHAGAARHFLADVFVVGGAITPAAIDTGTDLIARAIREVGVRAWVQAVRRFDDATHQHCLLVAGLAAAFAGSLGLSEADRHRLTKAALLHDVGKIHVPVEILNKPGRLTDGETAVMRQHPARGHAMLLGRGFEDDLLAVVRSHHEMLDGSGYPDGLRGSEIPDLVRLVTICDIYAALIERRAYRAPMPEGEALAILEGMAGRLDGDLVRAFRPVAEALGTAQRTT